MNSIFNCMPVQYSMQINDKFNHQLVQQMNRETCAYNRISDETNQISDETNQIWDETNNQISDETNQISTESNNQISSKQDSINLYFAHSVNIDDLIIIDKTHICQVIKKNIITSLPIPMIKLFVLEIFNQTTKFYYLDFNDSVNIISNRKDYILIDIDDVIPTNMILSDPSDTKQFTNLRLPQNDIGKKIRWEFERGSDLLITTVQMKNYVVIISYKIIIVEELYG